MRQASAAASMSPAASWNSPSRNQPIAQPGASSSAPSISSAAGPASPEPNSISA